MVARGSAVAREATHDTTTKAARASTKRYTNQQKPKAVSSKLYKSQFSSAALASSDF